VSGYRIDHDLLYNYKMNTVWNFEVGYSNNYRKSHFETIGPVPIIFNLEGRSTREHSHFTQVTYNNSRFKASLGLRRTQNKLFGSNLSKLLSLVYQIDDDQSLKLIAGDSYRSPTLMEIYLMPPNFLLFGNPNLLPETSRSYEIAYLKRIQNVFFQASTYISTYCNKISRTRQTGIITPVGGFFAGTANVFHNGNEFSAEGFELEFKYNHPHSQGLSAFLNYAYVSGDDGDRDQIDHYNFKFVPKHNISLGFDKRFKQDLIVSTIFKFVDDTNDFNDKKVDSTIVVDLNFTYKSKDQSKTHQLSIKNLFKEKVLIADYSYYGPMGKNYSTVYDPLDDHQIMYSYKFIF
ncbi:TonB-dependent receptor, partial [bacterium]|nr:TonB-dependent receptor [bacterium]